MRKEWFDAISHRKSKRTYLKDSIGAEKVRVLENLIDDINKWSGFHFQLLTQCESLFKGFKASYGILKGVHTCIALVANKNISDYKTKTGFYGEMLVLEATARGLSTCWIGGTYQKEECIKHIEMKPYEELLCVIVIGIAEEASWKDKLISKMNQRRKGFNEIFKSSDVETIPKWVIEGLNAVERAPSALNKQPFAYTFKNGVVIAEKISDKYGYEDLDLGISLLHFELGANKQEHYGTWLYKDGKHIYQGKV